MSTVYQIAGHNVQDFGKDPRKSRASFVQADERGSNNNMNIQNQQQSKKGSTMRQSSFKKHPKFNSETHNASLVKSVAYDDDEDFEAESKIIKEGTEDDVFYEPQDLGAEYFKVMQEKFKERNKVKTGDPKTLFDFWKSLRKLQATKKPVNYDYKVTDGMTDSQMKARAAMIEERNRDQKKLESILSSNPLDVEYTLKVHSVEIQKESTVSQFFQRRNKELERDDALKKRKDQVKNKEQRETCQNRLYQPKKKTEEYQEDKKKREKEDKKKEKQLAQDQEYQKQKKRQEVQQERTEFVDKIIEAHKKNRPEVKNFRTEKQLEEFYLSLTKEEREEYGLEKFNREQNQDEVKNDIKIYFQERAQDFRKIHHMKQGYDTNETDYIVRVWKNKTTDLEKQKYKLDFEDEGNVRECLDNFKQEQEKEQKEQEEKYKNEQEEQEKKEEKKIEKYQKKQEKTSKILAKPNDRLKLGKQILILKKMYPKDKYLRRLILEEFRNTRLAKFPEEYDIYDSDDENHTKERVKFIKNATLEDMEKPQKDKEAEIQQLFNQYLEEYQKQKETKVQEHQETISRQKDEDAAQTRYLNKKAKEFIALRQKRFEEEQIEGVQFDSLKERRKKAKKYKKKDGGDDYDDDDDFQDEKNESNKKERQTCTLKEFLEKTYKEMKTGEHKEATQRNFPHLTYGQSKNLKKRSYPSSFKRKFFQYVKQYLREQYGAGKRDPKEKLPFWAPGGDGMRCRIHDRTDCPKNCKYVTTNKKIWELMGNITAHKKWQKAVYQNEKLQEKAKKANDQEALKQYKEQGEELKLKGQREQNSAWVNEDFQREREQVMLTYDEAANCTFTPDVRLKREDRTFEKWVEDWGQNFKKKVPRIYKLGVLKQCSILIQQRKYMETYSKLRELFNIEQIKEYYATEAGRPYKMISKDSMYIVGKDDPEELKKKMHNEPFDHPPSQTILRDVYNIVTFLEDYEKQILKAKKETNRMIEQDPYAPNNPLLSKSMTMNSTNNNNNSTMDKTGYSTMTTYETRRKQVKSYMCPLGKQCPRVMEGRWPTSDISSIVPIGAQCEFAHTYAELKFNQELKSKKHMLKTYMDKLSKQKNPANKSWNPAGANFVQCHGCNQRCAICKLRGANLKRIADLKQKKDADKEFFQSHLKKEEEEKKKQEEEDKNNKDEDGQIKQKKSGALAKFAGNMATQLEKKDQEKFARLKRKEEKLEQRNNVKKELEEKYTKKTGYLQKANTLYKQERFSEAFKVICKAVEIVKQELDEQVIKDKEEDDLWKRKLGLTDDQDITPELVFQTLNIKDAQEGETENNGHILYQYATKRGIIGQKRPGVNQFLNIQIEESYIKIEKKLTDKDQDVIMMKNKIEKLEGEEEDPSESKKESINHKQLCPNIKEKGHCPEFDMETQQHTWKNQGWGDLQDRKIEKRCKFAHYPLQIYLEKNEQKIHHLNQSIKHTEQEIIKSTKPDPYKPPSAQTVIMSVNEWREKEREREMGKPNAEKKKKIDKSHREEIWTKDVDELTLPVHERSRKQN